MHDNQRQHNDLFPTGFRDIRSLLVSILSLLSVGSAMAYSFEEGGIYYDVSGTSATVTYLSSDAEQNFEAYKGDIVIPRTIAHDGNEYTVEYIGEYAFAGCSELTSISLPDGLKLIKKYAFDGCSELKAISVPGSVLNIGGFAFKGCTALEDVRFEDGTEELGLEDNSPKHGYRVGLLFDCPVKTFYLGRNLVPTGFSETESPFMSWSGAHAYLTSVTIGNRVEYIGNYLFRYCRGLSSVTFVEGSVLKSIGDSAFEGEIKISGGVSEDRRPVFTEFEIPATVEKIGRRAFCGCKNLAEITIPDNVTDIGDNAFKDCIGLSSLHIGDGMKNIGENAFDGCTSLETVTLGEGLKEIVSACFIRCSNLKSVNIPKSVETIGNSAFYGCSSLPSVNIPDGVATIGSSAFRGCSSLSSISIPSSVTSIGSDAFYECTGLQGCYITDLKAWCEIEFGEEGYYTGSNPLCCAHTLYLNNSKVQRLVIPDGITEVKPCAFDGCTSIVSVKIPDGVTNIGEMAFNECSQLLVATLSDKSQLEGIDDKAFYRCSLLNSINIPSKVQTIGVSAFQYCLSLSSVTFADDAVLTSIGKNAFCNCKKLTTIKIPGSVRTMGSGVFDSSGLVSIIISEGMDKIGSSAFYNCSSLESITLPSTLTSIGTSAFSGCGMIKAVYISDLFAYCNITYGNSQSGGSGMAWGYEDKYSNPLTRAGNLYLNGELIEDLVIPDGITKINMFAFWGGKCFKSITIPEGVDEIGYMAFASCDSVTSISLPSTLTTIYAKAFKASRNDGWRGGRDMYYNGDISQWLGITFNDDWNEYLSGNVGMRQRYYFNGEQVCGDISIPEGIATIGTMAFAGNQDITSVIIPSTVEVIGEEAFWYCSGLKNIYARPIFAPDLGTSALDYCGALANIYINPEDEELTVLSYESKWTDQTDLLRIAPMDMTISGEQTAESIKELKAAYCAVNDVELTYVDLTEAELDESVTAETLKDGDKTGNVLYYVQSEASGIAGDNIVVDGVAASVVLTDKQTFGCPAGFVADAVTYDRSYDAKKSTMYLPFAMTEDQLNGLSVLRFKGLSADGGSFVFEPVTATEANVPYLVCADNDGTQLTGIVNVTIEVSPDMQAMVASPQFVGTYEKRVLESTDDEVYYIFYDDKFYRVDTNVTVNPFRAYVKLPATAVSAAKQVMTLSIADGDDATGVAGISADVKPGSDNVSVYSADGRLLRSNVPLSQATCGMPKGVYIVNGKKITVR